MGQGTDSDLTPEWIVGFTEGEGSFFVDVQRIVYKLRHHVNFHFGFSIAQKEQEILDRCNRFLGFGNVSKYGTQSGYQLRIHNFEEALRVEQFFLKNPLRSLKKKEAFSLWRKALKLRKSGNHLNREGILEIATIRDELHCLSPR